MTVQPDQPEPTSVPPEVQVEDTVTFAPPPRNRDRVAHIVKLNGWEVRDLLTVPKYADTVVLTMGKTYSVRAGKVVHDTLRGYGPTFEAAYGDLIAKLEIRGIIVP